MATFNDSDLLLIDNGTSSETITFAQLKDGTVLNDSDLFLINDGSKTETVQWSEIKDEIGPAAPIYPEPDEVTGNPDFQGGTGTELDPYILAPVTVAPAGASGQSVETITIDVAGAQENQLVVWTDNSGAASGTRFNQPSGIVQADGTWSGRLVYNDTPDSAADTDYVGNLQIGDVYFRWTVTQRLLESQAPEISSVSLVEQNPGVAPRFTDQNFVATVTMEEEGVPVSTKAISAWVEGTITTVSQFNEPLQGTSTSGNQGDYTPIYNTVFTNTGNAFDGDEDTDATVVISSTSIFRLTKDNISNGRPFLQNVSTIEVLAWCEGGVSTSMVCQVNDGVRDTQIGAGFGGKFDPNDPQGKKWSGVKTFNPPININRLQIAQTGGTGQTAHIYAYKINGELMAANAPYGLQLDFAAGTNMDTLEVGDAIEQGATTATVAEINGTTVVPTAVNGTFVDGVNVTGPDKTITEDNTRKYLKFDSTGAVSDLLSNPQDPPYSTSATNPELTLTFPSTFPTGGAPDDEIADGATLTVSASAINTAGTSGPVTDFVQPYAAPDIDQQLKTVVMQYTGTQAEKKITTGTDFKNQGGFVYTVCTKRGGGATPTAQNIGTPLNPGYTYGWTNDSVSAEPERYRSWDEDGYTLGTDGGTNYNNDTYTAFQFVGADGFCKTVEYTGNGAEQTIDHGLGTAVGWMAIVKKDNPGQPMRLHMPTGGSLPNFTLKDNESHAAVGPGQLIKSTTDTNFTVGSDITVNQSGQKYLAFVLAGKDVGTELNSASDPALLKTGNYTGNGSSISINLGWEPEVIFVKNKTGGQWAWGSPELEAGRMIGACPLLNRLDSTNVTYNSSGFGFTGGNSEGNQSGVEYYWWAVKKVTARSQTQEEFDDQQLLFGTYEHRKHVECAEQAEANRDALIQSLVAQGYTLDEVLNLI